MALEPIRPPWLALRRRRRVDTIERALTKGELHAYLIALYSAYRIRLSGGQLIVE